MKNVETLSPYKIWWIEFRAQKGIVTRKDAKIFNKYSFGGNLRNLMLHFASRTDAEKYLIEKKDDFKRLSKSYEVRMCTDKQFSMSYVDIQSRILRIKFTSKQNAEMIVIGK